MLRDNGAMFCTDVGRAELRTRTSAGQSQAGLLSQCLRYAHKMRHADKYNRVWKSRQILCNVRVYGYWKTEESRSGGWGVWRTIVWERREEAGTEGPVQQFNITSHSLIWLLLHSSDTPYIFLRRDHDIVLHGGISSVHDLDRLALGSF
jgi:hypothetical protein